MTQNAVETSYYALVDEFASEPLAAPLGVFRVVRTETSLTPEIFDPETRQWRFDASLMAYISGGELGASQLSETKAAKIVEDWGGTIRDVVIASDSEF